MWERLVEVSAVYGAMTLALVLTTHFGAAAKYLRKDFESFLFAWTIMTWAPGLIYIVVGILPGQ